MTIQRHDWDQLPEAALELRRAVFIQEQQVPPELEWDETDPLATHYTLSDDSGRLLATARLYPTGLGGGGIGRMAVLPEHRGQGLGLRLMLTMLPDAASQYDFLELSAQEQALGFYQRMGFYTVSDSYMEAGIPHRAMRCTGTTLIPRVDAETTTPMTLGADTTTWPVETDGDHLELLRAMADQARRRLWIYDQQLSHNLYDDSFISEALSRLARRSRFSEVRFLIHDDAPLVQRRHRLVTLLRRLPSHISLRLVNTSYPHDDTPFVLVDDTGLLFRHEFGQPRGFARFNASRRVRPLAENFERVWEHGSGSVELRELPL